MLWTAMPRSPGPARLGSLLRGPGLGNPLRRARFVDERSAPDRHGTHVRVDHSRTCCECALGKLVSSPDRRAGLLTSEPVPALGALTIIEQSSASSPQQ